MLEWCFLEYMKFTDIEFVEIIESNNLMGCDEMRSWICVWAGLKTCLSKVRGKHRKKELLKVQIQGCGKYEKNNVY